MRKNLLLVCFLIGAFASWAKAGDDASSKPAINKMELMNLINDTASHSEFIHKDWNTRDPFDTSDLKEPSSESPAVPLPLSRDFVLQGIFLGSDKPSAIINGIVVGIGDTIKNMIVKEIKEESVTLVDSKGTAITLSLKQ